MNPTFLNCSGVNKLTYSLCFSGGHYLVIGLDYTASYYLTFRRWLLFECPFGIKQFDDQQWIDILQVPEESARELNNRICNLFIMPLMLAMENHTIDPIIIIKANNRLVRQSDSVSSKWLSCSFCLNGIQFSSVQYVFIYVASAAIKILSWHFPRSQNSTSAASSSGEENLSLQGTLKGKQHTGENKLTSAEHQSWSQHCCEAL